LNPLIEVNLAEMNEPRFSHILTAEARRFWKNLRDATIAEGGSASPKTM